MPTHRQRSPARRTGGWSGSARWWRWCCSPVPPWQPMSTTQSGGSHYLATGSWWRRWRRWGSRSWGRSLWGETKEGKKKNWLVWALMFVYHKQSMMFLFIQFALMAKLDWSDLQGNSMWPKNAAELIVIPLSAQLRLRPGSRLLALQLRHERPLLSASSIIAAQHGRRWGAESLQRPFHVFTALTSLQTVCSSSQSVWTTPFYLAQARRTRNPSKKKNTLRHKMTIKWQWHCCDKVPPPPPLSLSLLLSDSLLPWKWPSCTRTAELVLPRGETALGTRRSFITVVRYWRVWFTCCQSRNYREQRERKTWKGRVGYICLRGERDE